MPVASFLLPDSPASPNAGDMETIYVVMLIVAAVLVVAINAALIATAVRFRARRARRPVPRTAGRGTLARLAGGLGVVAAAIFVVVVIFTSSARDIAPTGPAGLSASSGLSAQTAIEPPPAEGGAGPLSISVIGQQWIWRYEYPVGDEDEPFSPVFSYGELVVPVDTTVMLEVTSTDVLHRWSVPALTGKVDAIPGQANGTWFRADREGIFEGASYAYSGAGYPMMRTKVRVVSAEEYETYIEELRRDISEAQRVIQAETEE